MRQKRMLIISVCAAAMWCVAVMPAAGNASRGALAQLRHKIVNMLVRMRLVRTAGLRG